MGHEREELSLTDYLLQEILRVDRHILHVLRHGAAKSLVVKILDSKGNTLMPAVLQIGQTAQAVAQEFSGPNGSGSPLPLAGVIAWTSSDPTIATVDPASGLVTAVGAGTANIVGTDPANGLTGSDVVSDQPLTAQSLVVTVTATGAAAAAVKK